MSEASPGALARGVSAGRELSAGFERRRRRLVLALDGRVAAGYPRFLRLWRRPVVRVLLILAALLLVAVLQPRTHLEWKLSHVLFDYEFGFVKRGLVGELFTLAGGPVTLDRFFWAFAACYLVLIGVVTAVVAGLPRTASPVILLYLCATPMLMRNVFYDWGRFDVFGLIAMWLIVLMLARDWPGRPWLYALAPLTAFAHEVNLLVVCPFALMAILVFEPGGWRGRWRPALALCLTAGATGAVLHLYGRLDVPPETMTAYIATKTPDRFEEPMYVLTTTLSENMAERAAFIFDKVVSFKYGFKFAVVVLLLYWLVPPRLRRSRVALAMLAIALAFLPLYLVATDTFRWLALQAHAAFAFLVLAVARLEIARLPRDRAYWAAASVLVPAMGV